MNNRASMAYVAFCVTLTCTAATSMTTTRLSTDPQPTAYPHEAFSAPRMTPPFMTSPLMTPRTTASLPPRHRFFARAYRFNRNNNRLANGGLHV